MQPKKIVLQTIRGEKNERVSASLLSGGAWTFNRRGYKLSDLLGKGELAAEIIVETGEEVGSDIIWPGSGYHNLLVHALGGEIIFRPQGTMDVKAPLLKEAKDVKNIQLQRLQENEWIIGIWETARLVHQSIGQKYLIGSSSWGPFTLAGQLYGVEKTMSGIYKDKQAIHAVLEFTTQLCLSYLKPFVDRGVEIISIAEPTASGDLISRQHFQEFVYPYLQEVITQLQEAGALITVHICGNITDRLDLVAQMGVDLLSIDYKVDLGFARKVLADKVALAGNVNPVLLQKGLPHEVVIAAQRCLNKGEAQKGRFILMPGCDIPPTVPLENIHTYLHTAHRWQG